MLSFHDFFFRLHYLCQTWKKIHKQMYIYKPDIIFMHSFETSTMCQTLSTQLVYTRKSNLFQQSINILSTIYMLLLSSLCNVLEAKIPRFG